MTALPSAAAANDDPTVVPAVADVPPTPALSDATVEEAASRRYLATLETLVDDALAHQRMPMLADTLAWTLARIVNAFGNAATGDILKRFGGYVAELAARERAQKEADEARKDGRALN